MAYCLGWMHTASDGCILPRMDAYCPIWMHTASPGCIRPPMGPGLRPPSGFPPGPGPLCGAPPQPLGGRGPAPVGGRMHPGQAECIQARPNASIRGSMHPAEAVCIQPRQHAPKTNEKLSIFDVFAQYTTISVISPSFPRFCQVADLFPTPYGLKVHI